MSVKKDSGQMISVRELQLLYNPQLITATAISQLNSEIIRTYNVEILHYESEKNDLKER